MNVNSLKKKSLSYYPYKNYEICRSLYLMNGFFVIRKCLNKSSITKILSEIKLAKNTSKYFDENKLPRRIEKIYNKGITLKLVDKIFKKLLKKIFLKNFVIFKDKFNSKPPGGEGFQAHYDGVFKFRNKSNKFNNGWYKYGNEFVNVLVALDDCHIKNGTIEISKAHENNFEELYNKTKKNGTPDLKYQRGLKFIPIPLSSGDVLVFKNTCPHKSKINNSKSQRRTLYYTYTPSVYGSKYKDYFNDKKESKNKTSKSLSKKNK